MEQIDAKSVRFLNAIRYHGGEATLSEIRKLAELNRNEVNYRFNKLNDMELIDVTKTSSPGKLQDQKVAHLTGKARAQLERGLGSASNAGLVISEEPDSVDVSRERFVQMEKRLERLIKAKEPEVTGEREEVKELRERVKELENDHSDLEDYVYEWAESVSVFLKGVRRVVEDELDVDMDDYFRLVQSD